MLYIGRFSYIMGRMFIRVKTTPNSPRRSVQIVARQGARARIIRHVGIAMDDQELERLKELAEFIKASIPALVVQPGGAGPAGRRGTAASPRPPDESGPERLALSGIHEVYGQIYRELNLHRLAGFPLSGLKRAFQCWRASPTRRASGRASAFWSSQCGFPWKRCTA